MTRWWMVAVNDTVGNTGVEEYVGPFRTEAAALRTKAKIERHLRRAGWMDMADVYELTTWQEVVAWRTEDDG